MARPRDAVVDAGHADDRARRTGGTVVALGEELLGRGLAAQELPGQVDVDDRAPVLDGHLQRGGVLLQAGVGHQHVEATQGVHRSREQLLHLVGFAHVGLERDRGAPGRLDLRHGVGSTVLVGAVVDGHLRTGAPEGDRHALADPAAGAGHEHAVARECGPAHATGALGTMIQRAM